MKTRILVVEDNPANMELMTYLLGAFGYAVRTATNGEAGVVAALKEAPDLLICDLQLPGISGLEVVKQLRERSEFQKLPMIAVTAYAMVGDRDLVLAAGFDGYISKPIFPETFVKEVEAFLPREQRSSYVPETPDPTIAVEPARQPGNAMVLVVDDSPVNLTLIKNTLEPCGYRVITAETVEAGMKLTRFYAFDLILSDLHMSPDSGLEFLRKVKADENLRSIPFLLCSSSRGDPSDGVEERAKVLGAEKCVSRPVAPERLLREVDRCLVNRREQSGGT